RHVRLWLAGVGSPGTVPLPGACRGPAAPALPGRMAVRASFLLAGTAVAAGGRLSHVCHLGWTGPILFVVHAAESLPGPPSGPGHFVSPDRERACRVDGPRVFPRPCRWRLPLVFPVTYAACF